MNYQLNLLFYFILCFVVVAPFATDRNGLAVSTTESPKEDASDPASTEKDAAPVLPKIYEMKINTNVSNRFAKTAVVSKVKNLAKTAQEATFSVVLPETAYISGFVMEIDGKSYQAYVKEKEEAKQIYQQAIDQGLGAAHVEASARDSNRFTVSVNVEPEKKAIFTLTYEELLQRQNEQYEIIINIHPGQLVKDLNVEVNIHESRPLKFVKSAPLRSGNEISKKDDDKLASLADINVINSTSATVKFSPHIERQKQLAKDLHTNEENGLSGQFVIQYDVERDPQGGEVLLKDGYFVHFFAPSELLALPKHVIFVLDTSGSMGGNRIQQLKEAMNSILSELKQEDLLNIVEFDSSVKVWNIDKVEADYEIENGPYWPSINGEEAPKKNRTNQILPPPYEATKENIEKAKKVVEKLIANGGTDILSGLEVGLKLVKRNKENKNSTHQPIIIFLTDGEPTNGETNPDTITSRITAMNTGDLRSPIFALSFGDYADKNFLQKIALKNLGFARHIYEAADASLQLEEFYKQISSPLLSNVMFKYVSNVTKLTKTQFPIFFRGSELVVAGIADQQFEPPQIYGSGLRGPISLTPKIETPVGNLERLWAYLTIKQILEERDAAEDKAPFTKKALDIALEYSFVTPVSSLVVVKPNQTSAVDTQDASKVSGFPGSPHFAQFGLTTPAWTSLGGGALGSASFAQSGLGGGFAAVGGPSLPPLALPASPQAPPAYRPEPTSLEIPEAEVAIDEASATELLTEEQSTTEQPTIDKDQYEDMKNKLPWLKKLLSENGTLVLDSGNYQLTTDEIVTVKPECPKTPINGTVGQCTPLSQCSQVFPLLSSEEIFKEYFCPLDTYVGICCPKGDAN